MENFEGKSLDSLITANRLNITDFLELAIQITEALSVVHSQNLVHKGIHPPNIMEGTLAYISPEQTGRMNRQMDYRSDLYSLGATFYFMLTGKPPFISSDPMELVHCHIAKTPSFPEELPLSEESSIPEILKQIILRLMEKEPEARYQSAVSLKNDLEICKKQWLTSKIISNFALGLSDHFDRFEIPPKLYGREEEINTLLESFERTCKGKSELVLVSGYSGIGKSSIVHEINKPIVKKQGHFISGKFDQYKRNIPYNVFIQAFQLLVQQILTEPDPIILNWKEKILHALGNNGQLMVEVLPELELVIGRQPTLIPLPPKESQNRFNLCFQNLVSVFTQPEHPLVIFLDDLQWADLSSLKLIELLMIDPDSHYLLMILSWRSNEVDLSHPLNQTIQKIQQKGVEIHYLELKPLGEIHVNEMLSETLHQPLAQTLPLAQLLLKKTDGNPFFLKQLLNALYEEKVIEFVPAASSWNWELSKFIKTGIFENVVDLMVNQIKKLESATQTILKTASCMGTTFDLRLLSLIHQKRVEDTLIELKQAVNEGWVAPFTPPSEVEMGSNYIFQLERAEGQMETYKSVLFRFAHDRIQQAAASLLTPREKIELHYNIGRLMLRYFNTEEQEHQLFEIVSHINSSLSLVKTQEEKSQIRLLNLRASRKARLSLAYETEFNSLKIAQSLLEQDSWNTEYQETLDIYTKLTESAFHIGNFAEMDVAANAVLNHGRTILDKIQVYILQSNRLSTEKKLLDAIRLLLPVLAEIGVHLPENPEISDIEQKLKIVQTKVSEYNLEEYQDINLYEPHKPTADNINKWAVYDPYKCDLYDLHQCAVYDPYKCASIKMIYCKWS